MTIIMIEATEEELRANRTVMDSVNDVLSTFADRLCGVSKINYANLMEGNTNTEECNAYEPDRVQKEE